MHRFVCSKTPALFGLAYILIFALCAGYGFSAGKEQRRESNFSLDENLQMRPQFPVVLDYSMRNPLFLGTHAFLDNAAALQDNIINISKRIMKLRYVPYIWGGGRIGSEDECQACRKCVAQKKLSLSSRLSQCIPCRRCGMDCSHFVNYVFKEAGLSYRYASSVELRRQSKSGLLSHYGFVDIGTDLSVAQPGDVLVFPKHIAILVKALSATHGDIIHATRFAPGDYLRLGGIKYGSNQNLKHFRGKLTRILRHKVFVKKPQNYS